MGYKNAKKILPQDLIELIQQYTEGEYLYIPIKESNKAKWGSKTTYLADLDKRNIAIYQDYLNGESILQLAEKYYLSGKSIERIITKSKGDYAKYRTGKK